MYAPNNHTCSVIPLWRVNNSVLFLYPWKEGKKHSKLSRLKKKQYRTLRFVNKSLKMHLKNGIKWHLY
jgi:arabinogalactan endo-1,4-beta-galactosidase